MKVEIYANRDIYIDGNAGTVKENNIEVLEFKFPEKLDSYKKYIEIQTRDLKLVDIIEDNQYVLKNNITKNDVAKVQIILKSLAENIVFKSNIFSLNFRESLNLSEDLEEESTGLLDKTLLELQKVQENIHDYNEKLDTKQEKEKGKGLSSNDFTSELKSKLENLQNYNDTEIVKKLQTKVDKVDGKNLSQNDFTDNYRDKLDNLSNYDDTNLKTQINTNQNKIEEIQENKVDKVEGKKLSTNDFTNEWKQKLEVLENYDDTTIREEQSKIKEELNVKTEDIQELAESMKEKIDYSVVEPLIKSEEIVSKNLYNHNDVVVGNMGTTGVVTQNENSNFKVSDFIKLKLGEVYSFSYLNQTQGRYHMIPNRLVIFNEEKQFLEQATSFITSTETQLENGKINFSFADRLLTFIPNKDCYIRIMVGININEIMITKGTDITYEEYFKEYIKREIKENIIEEKNLSQEVQKTINSIEKFCLNMFLYNRAICIGDSITEGYQRVGDIRKHKSYPTFLKLLTNWDIENAGQSGITTAGWWNSYKDKYDFSNYDIAFIYLGTNGGLTDTLQEDTAIEEGQTYENYANTNTGSYCKIIERALEQNPEIKIILIRWDGTVSANTTIKIAEKYGLETINLLDDKYFNLQDSKYHTDVTHYNSYGYLCFARNIYLHLKDMLKEHTIETEEV